VVLTGMGSDGMRGGKEIVAAGGNVIAQDEATSVVWGMPGAAVKLGGAQEILPLGRVAENIMRLAQTVGAPAIAAAR
jgi:two-component system chemotaxis response regulator CheB